MAKNKANKGYVNQTLINNTYPFFLNNTDLGSFYLYKIVSPEYLNDLTPLVTLQKLGEKTKELHPSATMTDMRHGDLLRVIMKGKKKNGNLANFLENDLIGTSSRDSSRNIAVYDNGANFPLFDYDETGLYTKLIIINLRDTLRWSNYRFMAGNYIDILLTQKTYGVFKIEEDENKSLYLVPQGVYENVDVNRSNPLNVDLEKINYPRDKFGGDKRASNMNRAIRQAEWRSFDK